MSASFFEKFNSLLAGPVSFHGVVPFLEKTPWRLALTGAVAMTGSVMATGALAVAFAGKQLLFAFDTADDLCALRWGRSGCPDRRLFKAIRRIAVRKPARQSLGSDRSHELLRERTICRHAVAHHARP